MLKNPSKGLLWEENVLRFLEGENYKILTKRFRIKGAEIDLIALRDSTVIFIEVKYRKNFDDFEGIVDAKKFQRIFMASEIFLSKNPDLKNFQIRFDIIFVSKDSALHHIENISL
jgi:putative endonuclease